MRRLFLFPEIPANNNGYGIAVLSDYNRYSYGENDVLVFFTVSDELPIQISTHLNSSGSEYIIVKRDISIKRKIKTILTLKHPSLFYGDSVCYLKKEKYSLVFCGDTIFYPFCSDGIVAEKYIIRFHNYWHKIIIRKIIYDVSVDPKYLYNLIYNYFFEKKIVMDTRFEKVFISNSDRDCYVSITGDYKSVTWPVININIPAVGEERKKYKCYTDAGVVRFVYFGTVSTHMKRGIDVFIKKVLNELKERNISYEFHLYGNNTMCYHSEINNIYAYGIYDDVGIPQNGNAIFVNPDITGGGIKLKVKYMIDNNLYFISTPFGMDGYENYFGYDRAFVANIDEWSEIIKIMLYV